MLETGVPRLDLILGGELLEGDSLYPEPQVRGFIYQLGATLATLEATV